MIKLNRREDCCGCSACANVCPKRCISMTADAEGFRYPKVDESTCVNCHLCEKVCPVIESLPGYNAPDDVYAVKNHDTRCRHDSSSGGAFTLIASEIIRRGGIVYGCALNDKLEARHIRVSSLSELQPLQSSKYVQSTLEDIMPQLRDDLKTGKIVLFSGTPCQVAGVRKFVSVSRCPDDKFFTVDVLCHGVPSPKLCADWLNILSRKYKSTPVALNFRDKTRGWKRLFVRVDFANKKRYFRFSGYDPYLGCFLHNKIQRPICFECPYNTTSRQGDITLGDFWGIGRIMPRWDDDKGISLAVTGSANGKNLIENILPNVEYKEMRLDDALKGNKVMLKHISGREGRDEFYSEYVTSGAEAAFGKFFKETPLFLRAYYRCARIGLDLYRKICHKGY